MIRIYYHYEELEEFAAGMWKITTGEIRKRYVAASAHLMKDVTLFEGAMRRATQEWIKSCQHNLTSEASNRIAYLGHAGCCIFAGSPEDATRQAWHTLNEKQQDDANAAAARVLVEWEQGHKETPELDTLFGWADNRAQKS